MQQSIHIRAQDRSLKIETVDQCCRCTTHCFLGKVTNRLSPMSFLMLIYTMHACRHPLSPVSLIFCYSLVVAVILFCFFSPHSPPFSALKYLAKQDFCNAYKCYLRWSRDAAVVMRVFKSKGVVTKSGSEQLQKRLKVSSKYNGLRVLKKYR